MAFNKVILVGNLTEEPQLKTTPSGVSVVSFRIAVGRRFKSEGQPDADFFTVVVWRSTAEYIAKHFSKGKAILVCGQLQQRAYKDKDGNSRNTIEVVADEVTFAGYKDGGQQNQGAVKTPTEQSVPMTMQENFVEIGTGDDLPF